MSDTPSPPLRETSEPRVGVWLLLAVMFLTSAAGLVIEIVAGRLVAPYVGMSLYTWTSVIAVVLGGFSLGHWVGGLIAEGPVARVLANLGLMLVAAAVTTVLILPLARVATPWILSVAPDAILAIFLVCTALFFAPSFFVGTISPGLTKLVIDAAPGRSGRALGLMFAAGAAGAILGTLATGFLFISWFGTAWTLIGVAGLLALMGAALLVPARSRRAAAASATAVVLTLAALPAWSYALSAPCDAESDYYCIRVIDEVGDDGRRTATLVLDHLVHSTNDAADPTMLHAPYLTVIQAIVEQLTDDGRRGLDAFFIGGGANTLPRAWGAGYPNSRLTVAELDPEVTRIARQRLWFEEREGTTVIHADARRALSDMPREPRFDVVLGDAFQDLAVPFHLTTAEFASEVAARLSDDGVYAINVVDSTRRPEFLFAFVRTLATAFRHVEVWVPLAQARQGLRATFVVAAYKTDQARDLAGTALVPLGWRQWPTEHLAQNIVARASPVLTDDYAPIDRLLRHVIEADFKADQRGSGQ